MSDSCAKTKVKGNENVLFMPSNDVYIQQRFMLANHGIE